MLDAAAVREAVRGTQAVLSAYNAGWTNPNIYEDFMRASRAMAADAAPLPMEAGESLVTTTVSGQVELAD